MFTLCTQTGAKTMWEEGGFSVQVRAEHVIAVVPTVPTSPCVYLVFSSGGRVAVPGTVEEIKDKLDAEGP